MPGTYLVPRDSTAFKTDYDCSETLSSRWRWERARLRENDTQYMNKLKFCAKCFYKNKTGGCDKRVTGSTLSWMGRKDLE